MIINRSALAAACLICPLAANAFDYTFVQGSYTDIDDFDSGITLAGSYDISNTLPNGSVIGSYTTAGDFTSLRAGGAYRLDLGLASNISVEAHAAFERFEYDVDFVGYQFGTGQVSSYSESFSDSGIAFGGLARYVMDDQLELFGDATYATTGDGDLYLQGGAKYRIADALHVVGSYTLADANSLNIGVRYTLGE